MADIILPVAINTWILKLVAIDIFKVRNKQMKFLKIEKFDIKLPHSI